MALNANDLNKVEQILNLVESQANEQNEKSTRLNRFGAKYIYNLISWDNITPKLDQIANKMISGNADVDLTREELTELTKGFVVGTCQFPMITMLIARLLPPFICIIVDYIKLSTRAVGTIEWKCCESPPTSPKCAGFGKVLQSTWFTLIGEMVSIIADYVIEKFIERDCKCWCCCPNKSCCWAARCITKYCKDKPPPDPKLVMDEMREKILLGITAARRNLIKSSQQNQMDISANGSKRSKRSVAIQPQKNPYITSTMQNIFLTSEQRAQMDQLEQEELILSQQINLANTDSKINQQKHSVKSDSSPKITKSAMIVSGINNQNNDSVRSILTTAMKGSNKAKKSVVICAPTQTNGQTNQIFRTKSTKSNFQRNSMLSSSGIKKITSLQNIDKIQQNQEAQQPTANFQKLDKQPDKQQDIQQEKQIDTQIQQQSEELQRQSAANLQKQENQPEKPIQIQNLKELQTESFKVRNPKQIAMSEKINRILTSPSNKIDFALKQEYAKRRSERHMKNPKSSPPPRIFYLALRVKNDAVKLSKVLSGPTNNFSRNLPDLKNELGELFNYYNKQLDDIKLERACLKEPEFQEPSENPNYQRENQEWLKIIREADVAINQMNDYFNPPIKVKSFSVINDFDNQLSETDTPNNKNETNKEINNSQNIEQ